MAYKILQIIGLWIKRHFLCRHNWKRLMHHDLPNEPYLSRCDKCGWISETIF